MAGEYVGSDGRKYHGTSASSELTSSRAPLATQAHRRNTTSSQASPRQVCSGRSHTAVRDRRLPRQRPGSLPDERRGRPGLPRLLQRDLALARPAPVASHVSFDVQWRGGGQRQKIRDTIFDFAGDFVSGDASIAFTASNDGTGVTYASVAGGQQTVSAGVGHERNGVFFG
jgi:hypothetical protein